MAAEDSQDVPMGSPPEPPAQVDQEPKYGGYSRFEVELEFVQSLANPAYLNHLASQKLLSQPAFVAYLAYLQYWSKPPYLKYLTPDVVRALMEEGMKASVDWHRES
ncbi:SOH1-domain-containing protein [Fusarium oxysporum]|nr:SOH1-domain-containing protein [Fusarium oxysporum]